MVGSAINFTWVNTSVPAMAGAKLVVSDSGDILSPKKAPEITAPAVIGAGIPSPAAIPISAIPMVPAVPQDVPVASEVIEEIIRAVGKKIAAEMMPNP